MNIKNVSRHMARFGYLDNDRIAEIVDPLPPRYWDHPANAWSPLLPSRIPGLEGVRVKYEGSHLSGSFKDRIMAATIGELLAREPDCPGVVVPSSGNAAVSAAALCARAGLPMIAIVPDATPEERVLPVLARGGLVVRSGEGPSQSYALADRLAEAIGFFRLYSTFASPWAEWGCRSLGREIAAQAEGPITRIVAPVSAGPVLVGTANGLREAGLPIPPLVAVQAAGCAPIAAAFASGAKTVTPWEGPVETAAAAIADRLSGYPQDGTRVLDAVRSSGGSAEAVTDAELHAARAALFAHDGIDAELSACAGIAWLRRASAPRDEGTLCIVTASGFKHTFAGDVPPAFPAPGAVRKRLEGFLETLSQPAILAG
ncbi:PLP-dependent lyase/thiolase [Pelagibacterium mangrovi]|uniref:PLP-dependent lyase/thiolase n=1 Tax=Pelagibacterium mangrovi TaxID=3119828 RepID=UPI002FC631C2